MTPDLALLLVALVLFILSAVNTTSPINLTAAGLACWVATHLTPW